MFSVMAVDMSETPSSTTFDLSDLNKNGYIEHDVPLTRNDASIGSNYSF